MGHDPARAATVGALALLLVATASLFPAGGFGSYPGADRAGVAGDGESTGTGLSAIGDADATQTQPDRTPTPTATPTPTPTPVPADDSDAGGGGHSGPDVTVGGVLLWLGGLVVAGVLLAIAASAVGTVAGASELPDGRLPRVRLFLAAVPRATVAVLLGSGETVASLGGALARVGSGLGTASLGGLTAVFRGVGAAVGGLATGVASVSLPSLSLPTGGLSLSTPDRGGTDRRTRGQAATTATEPTPAPSDDGPDGPDTVREAWARFPAQVPGVAGRVETRTPGELARQAVAAGLPADAVDTLTAAFRRVRYAGGVGETDRAAALAAFDRLRTDASDTGAGSDTTGVGGTGPDGDADEPGPDGDTDEPGADGDAPSGGGDTDGGGSA